MDDEDKGITWTGSSGPDVWHGTLKADTLSGGGGDDTLFGSEYSDDTDDLGDTLNGDDGNDVLYGYYGDDVLNGGNDNDRLSGGFGSDRLFGGAGNDILSGGLVENYSESGDNPGKPISSGGDYIDGGSGTDTVEIDYDVLVRETGKPFNVSFSFSSNFVVKLSNQLGTFSGEHVLNCEVLHYHGGNGSNNIVGGAGNDIISGGTGIDMLYGGGGDDVIIDRGGSFKHDGGAGTDTLQLAYNSPSTITLSGDSGTLKSSEGTSTFTSFEQLEFTSQGSGNDQINGLTKGVNKLSGGRGNDVINGGAKDDELTGGEGADTIHAGDGNDTLLGSLSEYDANDARDLLYGEGGNDTVFVSDIRHIVKGSVYDGGAGNDLLDLKLDGGDRITAPTVSDLTVATIAGFEKVTIDSPSAQDYTIKLSTAQFSQFKEITTYRFQFSTDATIQFADNGAASLAGKVLKLDAFQLADGGQTLNMTGADFQDRLNPEVVGGSGNDVVIGPQSSLVSLFFSGGVGDDKLVAGSGSTSFGGGEGSDLLVGSASKSGFSGGAGEDTMSYANSASGVTVSLASPSLSTGDAAGDTFTSVENLTGTAYSDKLTGDSAANLINAGNGDDILDGGAGADVLIGGSGSDTASYASASAAVVASLANASINKGEAAGDTYSGIERLTGSAFADTLNGANIVNNTINGGAGDDTLKGYTGNDHLSGGAGNDTFAFNTALNATTNVDDIRDFKNESGNNDRFLLDDAFFAGISGNAAKNGELLSGYFKNLAVAAQDANDRIVYNQGSGELFYDANGLTAGGQTLFAKVTPGTVLTYHDFFIN